MTSEHLATAAELLILLIIVAAGVFLIIRMRRNKNYRFAVGVAFLAAFLILWVNLAVGIIGEPDDPANLMYVGVLAVGFIGAIIARFHPSGMTRTLFAMALVQALVAVITALGGLGAPVTPALSLLIFNGILISLWVGSAKLFRKAAREQSPAVAGLNR